MNTAGLLRDAALTVPVATLRRVVTTLLAHGRIRRGYLGLGAHPVRLPVAWQQQGQEAGLLIVSIEPGSPADRGGFLMGDTLVALDGTPVRRHDDIQARLTPESVGTSVRVRLIRGGEVKELTVTIGERPAR
jgi:S1-C subfamily serine protease